jgi:hypothetical protein
MSVNKFLTIIFITLLLIVFIGGCGTSGSEPTSNLGSLAAQGDTGAGVMTIDACQVVTQDDATKMFGDKAVQDQGGPVLDPNLLGECLWTWDTEAANQLLQLYVWNGEQYYSAPSDSQPLEMGDMSYVRVNKYTGVDIEWVQDGRTISLTYSNIGSGMPDPSTKVDEVKALAEKAAAKL